MATTSKKPKTRTKTPAQKRQKRSRAETERKLIDVALDLIRHNGVLAGLNLREVAEGAGVNRGNIYHYFGSRQELLRAAINHRFAAMTSALAADRQARTFIEQRLRHFRAKDTMRDSELRALLVIDGDNNVDPMPLYEPALSQLRQEVINGDIDRAHDLEALQVALNALLRGYRIFRVPYAKRLGIKAGELDTRVTGVMRTWLEAMARPPAANRGDDGA
jgi:AcrR family transcriptional regulator